MRRTRRKRERIKANEGRVCGGGYIADEAGRGGGSKELYYVPGVSSRAGVVYGGSVDATSQPFVRGCASAAIADCSISLARVPHFVNGSSLAPLNTSGSGVRFDFFNKDCPKRE